MKTHPDSIFLESADFVQADNEGLAVNCAIMSDPEGFAQPVEFVPASAYLDAIRERDAACVEMAKARDNTKTAEMRRDAAMFILLDEAEERGGQFKRMHDAWKAAERELTQARATIAQLRTAETERPGAPTIQPPPEWAWYLDGASPCVAGYRTKEAALAGAVRDHGEDHRIRVGKMRNVDPAELFDLDDVVERAEDRLYELVEDGHVSPRDGAAEALADWARRFLYVDPSRICEGRAVYPEKAAQKFAESVRELTGKEPDPETTDEHGDEARRK